MTRNNINDTGKKILQHPDTSLWQAPVLLTFKANYPRSTRTEMAGLLCFFCRQDARSGFVGAGTVKKGIINVLEW